MDAIFTEPTRCSNTNTGAKIKFKRGIIDRSIYQTRSLCDSSFLERGKEKARQGAQSTIA